MISGVALSNEHPGLLILPDLGGMVDTENAIRYALASSDAFTTI